MDRIKNIVKNYKYDLIIALILLTIFTVLASIFVGHQGSPLIDCFINNAFMPSEMLRGKVLYKDIFTPYGPFSYQLLAALFLIFGEHLNTLYGAGIVTSLIILSTFYLIARTITSKLVSFTATFIVMIVCVFHYYIFNFILPYSSAMTYAFCTFLLSLLFCIYYLKSSNYKFIMLSFFFMAISILSKLDFAPFLLILLIIAIFLKPVSLKIFIYSAVLSLIIPVISWSVLFIQGLNLSDLSEFLYYFNQFVKSPLLERFHADYTGLYLNERVFWLNVDFISLFLIISLSSLFVCYPILLLLKKLKFSRILHYIAILIFIPISSKIIYDSLQYKDSTFSWIAISTALILLIISIYYLILQTSVLSGLSFRNKLKKLIQLIREINIENKILILLILAGISGTLRSFFFIDLHSFGTFFFPLLLLINLVFLVDYIPEYIKFLNKDCWKKTILTTFISISICLSFSYILTVNKTCIYPVSTNRGTIYTILDYAPLNTLIKYIDKRVSPDSTVVMLPKSPVLNFLTNRKGDGWYYDLIPPVLLAFGEDKVLEDFKKNPPDYIFLNNFDTKDWGFQYFGRDYGRKIFLFIENSYVFRGQVGSPYFWIRVYKKKS